MLKIFFEKMLQKNLTFSVFTFLAENLLLKFFINVIMKKWILF